MAAGGMRALAALTVLGVLVLGAPPLRAEPPLPVVATFSILGDVVAQLGGDRVAVETLVGPDGDAHVFEPSTQAVRRVSRAALVVANGRGLEPWLPRLVKAAGYRGPQVTAAAGVGGDRSSGSDPHVWQSVANVRLWVEAILTGLIQAAPADADRFQAHAAAYRAELDRLEAEIRAAWAAVPADQRLIFTSHDAFGHYAAAYGVTLVAPVGVSTEAEPTAADVARMIRQIRASRARAVFVESITNPRLMEQIARESGAVVGGKVFSDALSPPGGPAASYPALMRHNTRLFIAALTARP
jgi:zinc/manganese transport system substrate-binding protein